MASCAIPNSTRRTLFWATQPSACGTEQDSCGTECGIPGLTYADQGDGACGVGCDNTIDPDCPTALVVTGRSIATNDWVRGLVINMLMTDGREADTICGVRPGSNGGHWTESYISSGDPTVGTLMRTIVPTGRISTQVATIAAYAQATLQRLVTRGVALSVTVTGTYVSGATMNLDIEIVGQSAETTNVSLLGSHLTNSWVWE